MHYLCVHTHVFIASTDAVTSKFATYSRNSLYALPTI